MLIRQVVFFGKKRYPHANVFFESPKDCFIFQRFESYLIRHQCEMRKCTPRKRPSPLRSLSQTRAPHRYFAWGHFYVLDGDPMLLMPAADEERFACDDAGGTTTVDAGGAGAGAGAGGGSTGGVNRQSQSE